MSLPYSLMSLVGQSQHTPGSPGLVSKNPGGDGGHGGGMGREGRGCGRSSDVTDCVSGRIAPRKPRADTITGAMLFHNEEIDSTPTHFWTFNKKQSCS